MSSLNVIFSIYTQFAFILLAVTFYFSIVLNSIIKLKFYNMYLVHYNQSVL